MAKEHGAADHGHESSGGMPQFNFEDFEPQLIWLAITFIALFIFLARVVLPRIGAILEERKDRIARDLDEAAKLKEETEAAVASYEQSLAEARANAHKIAQETKNKLDAEIAAERSAVEAQIMEKAEDAEKRIAQSKEQALSHVSEAATDTAEAIVEKLLGGNVSRDEIRSAVDSNIAK